MFVTVRKEATELIKPNNLNTEYKTLLLPGMNSGQVGNNPFRWIESQDADWMESFQSKTNESFGTDGHIMQELLVSPLNPLK